MDSVFNSGFFAGNRQRLQELCSPEVPVVVTANGLLQRGGDSSFAFEQDANFWYLTGLDEPDLILVMDGGNEYLIVPDRNSTREAFDGKVSVRTLIDRSGINQVYEEGEGWAQLRKRIKQTPQAATPAPAPAYAEHYGIYTNPARAALVQKLKNANPKLELSDITLHLSRLRMVKQESELQALQTAIDITLASIREALRPSRLGKYHYEYELETEVAHGFRRRGATGHAFEPIVASGERACTLHNVANSGLIAAGELVIVDVGAQVEHYAADITRTVGVGRLSRRQHAVHAATVDVQQYAVSLLKPGTLLREYEQQVEAYMGEKLRELELIKAVDHDSVRHYFPHATSHFLGLNVHDAGDYNRPLEPGMVLTVEPGIYIQSESIGIRIEDDILITPQGAKILSAKLPRRLG